MLESIKKGFGLMIGMALADMVIYVSCRTIVDSKSKTDKAEV